MKKEIAFKTVLDDFAALQKAKDDMQIHFEQMIATGRLNAAPDPNRTKPPVAPSLPSRRLRGGLRTNTGLWLCSAPLM